MFQSEIGDQGVQWSSKIKLRMFIFGLVCAEYICCCSYMAWCKLQTGFLIVLFQLRHSFCHSSLKARFVEQPTNSYHVVRFSSATLELQLPLDWYSDQCFPDEPPIVTILQKQRAANWFKIPDEPPACMTRSSNQCCKGNINAKPSHQYHNRSSFLVSVLENIHALVGLEFIWDMFKPWDIVLELNPVLKVSSSFFPDLSAVFIDLHDAVL